MTIRESPYIFDERRSSLDEQRFLLVNGLAADIYPVYKFYK